jgi:hypothetical protein
MASVHPVLKAPSWRVSVLIQTERQIDRRCPRPSDHPMLLISLLLLCNSSDATKKWTVGSSDVPRVSPNVPTRLRIAPTLAILVPSVHRMVSFLFLFFLVFGPWKIDYLLILACGILASLGPRNVYKDMLNNMVSPIDHVVMNHQNQTRTNGIWGHIRYNLPLFGDLWQHNQSRHKFAKIDKIRATYTCLDAYHHPNSH